MKKLIPSKPVPYAVKLRRKAYKLLKIAIELGTIPKIDSHTKCVDCGKQAKVYDHRNYEKPLVVEPVCVGCNVRRGGGFPLLVTDQSRINQIVEFRRHWYANSSGKNTC